MKWLIEEFQNCPYTLCSRNQNILRYFISELVYSLWCGFTPAFERSCYIHKVIFIVKLTGQLGIFSIRTDITVTYWIVGFPPLLVAKVTCCFSTLDKCYTCSLHEIYYVLHVKLQCRKSLSFFTTNNNFPTSEYILIFSLTTLQDMTSSFLMKEYIFISN